MLNRRARVHFSPPALLVGTLSTWLLGVVPAADAAEWRFQPFVDLGAVHDDNLELSTGNAQSTSGYVLGFRLNADVKTELTTARIRGTVAATDYQREGAEDKNEQRMTFNVDHRTSERGTLGVSGQYRRDAIFEPLRVEEGAGDVRDTDIALTGDVRVRRHYTVLHPTWNWLLTERSSARVGYRATRADFSGNAGTGLVDYDDDLISAKFTHVLTARDSFSVTLNAAQYRPDTMDTNSNTRQLLGGWERMFSEQVTGEFTAGLSRTEETVLGNSGSDTGAVIEARLTKESDISTLEGVLSRDTAPSGIGRALRTDQIRVYWTRFMDDTIELVVRGGFLRQRALAETDTTADRRYYDLSPELRWHWLEDLQIIGSYRLRYQRYDAQSQSATSHAVFFGISYSL